MSKKAVSYSSPSTTNSAPFPSRHDWRKFSGTPPIKKDGSRPASVKTCARIDEVVVLPWVPATTTECLPSRKSFPNNDGNDSSGILRSVAASTSTWSLRQTFPTTTHSDPQSRFAARKPSKVGTPSSASCVDIGG